MTGDLYALEFKKRRQRLLKRIALYAALILYAFFIIYPIFWVGVNSLKNNQEIFTRPWGLPADPKWGNYREAWTEGNIGGAFKNSVIVTATSVLAIALMAPMAGYALARLRFTGQKAIFYLFLSGMFIAPITGLIPLLKLLRNLSLVNSYWALILPNVAYGLPLSVFIVRSFFVGIPKSIEDATRVDGLSGWQTYWLIMLPMALPALYTVIILQTVYIWNEFLFALVFIRTPDLFTLPRALVTFKGTFITSFGPLNAAVILSAVPTIILYSIFSDKIRRGMSMGFSAKG